MTRDRLSELCGWSVSRETFLDLERYHDALLQWSKTHNLIGPKERDALWDRHIADCLQLWPHVRHAKSVADIGSGAGLPGLVLAIATKSEGGPEFWLIEASTKRCAFLRYVSNQIGLKTHVLSERVENVSRETFDVVTARAVADLTKLLEMSVRWTEKGAKAVFLKGRSYEDELTEARRYWIFKTEVTPSKSDSLGVVLSLTEVGSNHG